MISQLKTLFAVGTVAAALMATAQAAEVTVSGFTNGAFNGMPALAPQTATLFGLTFINSTFSQTTAGGFAAFGSAPATPNFDNLGSISLTATDQTYTGNTFSLRVTFTAPSTITGSNTTLFTSTLTGTVTSTGNGGVLFDFNNTPQTFTFSNSSASGSFQFSVNDVSVTPGRTVAVTGQVTGASQGPVSVPEGGSALVLVGIGLVAIEALRRKLATA